VLVLRFEAENAEELARIQTLFRERLQRVAPELTLPF
jgi:phosphomannomutase/phosphoglucomutase